MSTFQFANDIPLVAESKNDLQVLEKIDEIMEN